MKLIIYSSVRLRYLKVLPLILRVEASALVLQSGADRVAVSVFLEPDTNIL